MKKSAYLDAMGITRWTKEEERGAEYIVLVDNVSSELDNHTIIATVLSLIDCPFRYCKFVSSIVKGTDVIWDMRRIKLPKSNAVLLSAPVSELENSVVNKRELWNAITELNEVVR